MTRDIRKNVFTFNMLQNYHILYIFLIAKEKPDHWTGLFLGLFGLFK